MSTPKGYTNQGKDITTAQHATLNPISKERYGLDVDAIIATQNVVSDTAETGSTTTRIKATAHAAKRGDRIRFTSGNLSGVEVVVAVIVDANNFDVGEALSEAPANGDGFDIHRPRKPQVDADGLLKVDATVQSAPIEFVRDSVDTEVSEDTGTPANSRPLPVKVLDGNGAEVLNDIKTSVQTLDNAISGSEMQVDVVAALPAGDNNIGNVDIVTLPGTVESDIGAIKTAVEILDNAISGSEMQVDVVGSLPAGTNNIGDVDVLTLPSLPAGNNNIGDVDVASLPGTVETDITAIKTAVEILDNAISGSEMQVDVVSSALPTGAATEATLSAASAKLPASLGQQNTAGSLSVTLSSDHGNVSVVQGALNAILKIRNAYASTNVTTADYVELSSDIGGTAAKELEIFDSSGQTLLLAFGAAASEVDKIYIVPGGNGRISLSVPANTRLSVKAVSATASTGELLINLYG